MCSSRYTKQNRLSEVIALIQILAMDKHSYRTENGMKKELQIDKPLSAKSWTELCSEHPEFFRVSDTKEHNLSLIARHVSPDKMVSAEFIQKLIEVAIDLHDKAHERADKWYRLIPILAALIGATSVIIVAMIKT